MTRYVGGKRSIVSVRRFLGQLAQKDELRVTGTNV